MNRRLTVVLAALAAATALTVVVAATLAPRPARLHESRTGDAALVERAATIVTNMGAHVLGPDEVRAKLKLAKRG